MMKKNKKSAFTLVEIIIVVAIISFLVPGILMLMINLSNTFTTIKNLLSSQSEINEFKENFRIICWRSTAAEFRKDGLATGTSITGGDVFYNVVGRYDNLPIASQPTSITSMAQRDSIFLTKLNPAYSGSYGVMIYDASAQTISWAYDATSAATITSSKTVILTNVLRPDSTDYNNTGSNPVFNVALNNVTSGVIACLQVSCKIRIPTTAGNEKLVNFRTSVRIRLI